VSLRGIGARHGSSSRVLAAVSSSSSKHFRWGLDLSDLSSTGDKSQVQAQSQQVQHLEQARFAITFSNTTLPNGDELACLNCDPELFKAYAQERGGAANCKSGEESRDAAAPGASGHGKHPNAPGYDKWEASMEESLLAVRAIGGNASKANASHAAKGTATTDPCTAAFNISSQYLQDWDLEAFKPRLRHLWAQRRLVVMGMNPLHEQMDFVEALVNLARNSPMLIPEGCGEHENRAPHCGALLSGLRPAASVSELRQELIETFGMEFIEEHEFNTAWSPDEQRRRVKTLLSALKNSYRFYRQTCLAHEEGDEKCDRKEQALLVGQIACPPDFDGVEDDCVYAELRHCKHCNGTSRFFEYARFHGPLTLFGTRSKRDWVMGQCEEFSRAGYALLASLGYEARYVLDFTDHVWIEVKIGPVGNTTWLHADPSEGVLDAPLMYEKGWGKQLSMIFAFTPWSVDHVTARYTNDYQSTVYRRGVGEDQLQMIIEEANDRLKYELPRNKWGYTSQASHQWRSVDRSFEEIALWSHFEAL
jgi:hypothetical protein